MLDALIRAFLVVGGISAVAAWTWPGMFPQADPVAVLVRYHTPNFYTAVVAWYYVAPGVAVFLIGQFLISTSRIWFARMGVSLGLRSRLPAWPLSPTADGPAIVVGEVHHPVRAIEIQSPEWLTIPERGLYTGVAIFGAVGSGKTSACMHPFARQLLRWQANNPARRPAALILEVKGDFCHDIRAILKDAGREADYIELSLDGRITWNPLSAMWLDSYSLAYTVASLLNQLFGKGKEPFWQQAYTNLVRWIIELYRVLRAYSWPGFQLRRSARSPACSSWVIRCPSSCGSSTSTARAAGDTRGSVIRWTACLMQAFPSSYEEPHGRKATINSHVADRTDFWWSETRPDDRSLWESKIELGEKFFEEVIRNPVPLDLHILKSLSRSSLGLDLYLWLTYRTFALKAPMRLSWKALYRQFGANQAKAGDARTIDYFRTDCLRELKKIKTAWPGLQYRTDQGVLVVGPSLPCVQPRHQLTD